MNRVNRSVKQVIIVRQDIGMKTGKKCAQSCHASVSAADIARTQTPGTWEEWRRGGQKKIVLKIGSEAEIRKVYQEARDRNIPAYLVADAGLTQLEPGTITALGIGPVKEGSVDPFTGDLKLL